jgi:hypothetical protein
MTLLVEFPVVRQERLRHHAEQPAALDRQGAIVDAVAPAQGRADQQQRSQARRFGDHPGGGGLDRVEQGLLQQQVLDRVGREPELGEDREGRPGFVAGPGQVEHRVGVAGGIARMAAPRAGRHPGEAVTVQGPEARREVGKGFGMGLGHGRLSV